MHQDMFACYMNDETGILDQWYPRSENRPGDNFYYWWQAHVLDVLVDAYERSGDPALPERIGRFCRSLESYNGGTFKHNYYDDMEWTALALLRAYDALGDPWYKKNHWSCGRISKPRGTGIAAGNGLEERPARLQKHPGQRPGRHFGGKTLPALRR